MTAEAISDSQDGDRVEPCNNGTPLARCNQSSHQGNHHLTFTPRNHKASFPSVTHCHTPL